MKTDTRVRNPHRGMDSEDARRLWAFFPSLDPNESFSLLAHGAPITRQDGFVHVSCDEHEAEDAIRTVTGAGIDAKALLLVGKGYRDENYAVGFYVAGDRIRCWGGAGAFWSGAWNILRGPAVFFLPGLGLTALAGPIVSELIGVLEAASSAGGLSALGAALIQMGVPNDRVVKYEAALRADQYVLIVHGDVEDVERARSALAGATANVAA